MNYVDKADQNGYTPVSYTHLDVYKRQAFAGAGVGVELVIIAGQDGVQQDAGQGSNGQAGQDVYKRQTPFCIGPINIPHAVSLYYIRICRAMQVGKRQNRQKNEL